MMTILLPAYVTIFFVVLPFISTQRYPNNGMRQRIAPIPPYPNVDYNDNDNSYDYSSASQNQAHNNQIWPNSALSQPSFNVDTALHTLEYAPKWVPTWPQKPTNIGQVSAVSLAPDGSVFVFHRASRIWDETSFTINNVYRDTNESPIAGSTVAVFNSSTGKMFDQWGENLFYLPHGLTVDKWNNIWVTDVALHQVMKFTSTDKKIPALTLGVKFTPGNDEAHFCKPTAVAVMDSGEFFVADGYCNTRVIKYSKDGEKILQWGRSTFHGVSGSVPRPYSFFVPHSIALAEDKSLICVADRENGRIQCFHIGNGTYVSQFHSPLMGSRLFSVAYSPIEGGRLYVVNGPEFMSAVSRVRGFVINISSGKIVSQFGPNNKDFANPHDIAVSPSGREVYVVELNPYKVHKFEDITLPNVSDQLLSNVSTAVAAPKKIESPTNNTENTSTIKAASRVKPTATVEGIQPAFSGGWNAWIGVAGGVAGGLGAVLICLIGTAALLARARRRGKYESNLTQRLMDETAH